VIIEAQFYLISFSYTVSGYT